MSQLTINYGYDVHSISLDEKTRDAIIKGVRVAIDGQGFHHEEDGLVVDPGLFNALYSPRYDRLTAGSIAAV